MKRLALAALVALQVTACSSPPSRPPSPPPQLETPAQGKALLYLFRPQIDQIRMSDSPEISLDGVTIAHLPHASYIVIPLASGKHRLKLSPSAGESALWNSESSFEATADQRYFVAVWHTDQPTPSKFNLPLQVRGALLLIPMGGASGGSNSVTLEQVDEGTALFGLTDLNRVSTQSSSAAESRQVETTRSGP